MVKYLISVQKQSNKTVIQLVKEIKKRWKEISWKLIKLKKKPNMNQIIKIKFQ